MSYKEKFADISAYQPSDLDFFKRLWNQGYRGVVVKVTEGENWVSPKWQDQVKNALAVGFQVGVYHFARWSSVSNAVTEANVFLNAVKSFGFDKSTVAMFDCETNDYRLSAGVYQQALNAALDTVRPVFPIVSVYASKSWWTSFLNSHNVGNAKIWVAGYDISDLGVDNAAAWQWDDGQRTGTGVDTSWDFDGVFTKATTYTASPKPVEAEKPAETTYETWTDDLGVVWYKESGTFTITVDEGIVLRWGATTKSSRIGVLQKGDEVKYDAFCYAGGYVWIRQPRSDGYGYLPTGNTVGGKRTDYWGTFK